ncbi:MAG: 2-phosphosulfolactate phosphatase [Bacteroidota bacterium]
MFPLFAEEVKGKQVMVIDILRATTSMVVMLENGAQKVIPVAKVEEALAMKALADEQGRANHNHQRNARFGFEQIGISCLGGWIFEFVIECRRDRGGTQ